MSRYALEITTKRCQDASFSWCEFNLQQVLSFSSTLRKDLPPEHDSICDLDEDVSIHFDRDSRKRRNSVRKKRGSMRSKRWGGRHCGMMITMRKIDCFRTEHSSSETVGHVPLLLQIPFYASANPWTSKRSATLQARIHSPEVQSKIEPTLVSIEQWDNPSIRSS